MAESIENHGVIGDLRTVALVDVTGRIDYCCWPRFDSPSIFISLLGDATQSSFELSPQFVEGRRRQMYLDETNILLTRTLSADGVAEVSDFMSVADADGGQRLVRRAKAVRGHVRFRMRCAPAFDYGRGSVSVREEGDSLVFAALSGEHTSLRLRSSIPLKIIDQAGCADFELAPGESASFILESAELGLESLASDPAFVTQSFKATADFWRLWSAGSTYKGRWREMVNRSALTLKLLTSKEHGSIVAAATFGLPETIGGDRNWDYRYTWMRDAAFTVYAFLRLGHTQEANAFMHWLGGMASKSTPDGRLQLLYRVDGGEDLAEADLPHLAGFLESRPVRIGNGAANQLQLDIYGELMDAAYLSDKYGERISWEAWQGVVRAINWVAKNWEQPDEGIWEIRGERREFLYSRLMCWVALDRALRLAQKRSLPAPVEHWTLQRDAIYQDIHSSFWNEEKRIFVQSKGSDVLDASCLLMPLVLFISPIDPRWLSTLQAVGEQLRDDSLIYRYAQNEDLDGLKGVEGTFNMCSFWYVECVARSGDLKKARFLFEKMLSYANHLGLFSEETGPAGEHLGNFPQAFTHLALISAAVCLDRLITARNASAAG